MYRAFLTQFTIGVFVLLLVAAVAGKRIVCYKGLLGIFFLVYFGDNVLIVVTNRFSNLQVIPNHVWEGFLVCSWSGKLYSILFTLGLFAFFRKRLSRNDIGLTMRQRSGSVLPAVIVVLALAGWALMIGMRSPKGKADLETLIYLAIMPGLNEELVYRGILLGILDKILPTRFRLLAAPFGWGAIITSLLFGLLHSFWFDGQLALHFELIAFENSTISGLIFAWLRARTGSLVMPILAHGAEDFLFFLPRMV